MGRKEKVSDYDILPYIDLIDNKEISLRKASIKLGLSHVQLRERIKKIKELGITQKLKDELEVIKKRKNNLDLVEKDHSIDQISKDMDQELYKDHIGKDKKNIDPETYDKLVNSLRKQYEAEEGEENPHKEQLTPKEVYLSLDLLRGLYVLITGKSEHHKLSRKDLLIFFSDLFKDQVNILR